MNLFHLVYIPIILYAFKDYRKAFLLYAVTTPFLSALVPFLVLPGLPLVQMETFMNTFWLMYISLSHICNKKQRAIHKQDDFPLKGAFCIYIISIAISSILSPITPIFQSTMAGYQTILNGFVFVYLLWRELRKTQDIQFFIKGLVIVFSIAVIYGFFEKFSDFYNPLKEYEISLNPDKEGLTFDYSKEDRIGTGRVVSIFNNALACSAYSAVALAFFLYMNMRYKKIWNSSVLLKISFMCGLSLLLLFSNSRGGIVYLGISLLFMLNLKSTLSLLLLLPIFGFAFYDLIAPYFVTISSIFDIDSEAVGGSSLAMRIIQFSFVLEIWKNNLLFGYGPKGETYWGIQESGVLGTESVWLKLLLNQGFIGVVAYIFLCCSLIKLATGKSKRYMIGAVLACIAVMTATVGLSLPFFMCLLLVVYRLELLSNPKGVL